MLDAKIYTNKLPITIQSALKNFSGNDCYLIKKTKDNLGLERKSGNCHINVQQYIDKLGGEMLNGWLLFRDKKIISYGLWVWSFHSVWKTTDGKLIDVTSDKMYEGSEFTTFLPDATRKFDGAEGVGYNNIIVLENKSFADKFGMSIGRQVEVGKVYWAIDNFKAVKELDEHSGQYRYITEEYPHNIKLLEEKYNVVPDGNGLKPKPGATIDPRGVPVDLLFDFSLGAKD